MTKDDFYFKIQVKQTMEFKYNSILYNINYDKTSLENKEIIDGKQHNRPCCYLFKFSNDDSDIYWMIPISSKVDKYKLQYQKSIDKYGICDNISFGYVLGEECAFLPQNLFPITERYINNIYIEHK